VLVAEREGDVVGGGDGGDENEYARQPAEFL